MYQHVIHYLLQKALEKGSQNGTIRELDVIMIGTFFWYDGYETQFVRH